MILFCSRCMSTTCASLDIFGSFIVDSTQLSSGWMIGDEVLPSFMELYEIIIPLKDSPVRMDLRPASSWRQADVATDPGHLWASKKVVYRRGRWCKVVPAWWTSLLNVDVRETNSKKWPCFRPGSFVEFAGPLAKVKGPKVWVWWIIGYLEPCHRVLIGMNNKWMGWVFGEVWNHPIYKSSFFTVRENRKW